MRVAHRAVHLALSDGTMIFCTLFNLAYLPQGITLYRSLERTRGDNFVLYVLCMDDMTHEYLDTLALPNLRIVLLRDIEDAALLAVKAQRSVGEYCWTCTTPLVMYVQGLHREGTVVTYVDADIAFLGDPQAILDEMGDGSIFVHEHDFAPEHAHLLAGSGRFNVGVTAFRKDEQGRACLARWRAQCIDECVMDPSAGKCGDQNYLDEWPALYSGLVVSRDPGVGLAPWNISKHRLETRDGTAFVDGRPALFYHFHGVRLLRPRLHVRPTLIASGAYHLSPDVLATFYAAYAREIWQVARNYPLILADLKTVPDLTPRMEDDQIIFTWLGRMLPIDRNVTTMAWLFGFDEKRGPPSRSGQQAPA